MKKKQKYVTVLIVLLFCVLVRAADGGDCMNMSASERNTCLRAQGDEEYNRAVDYFTRGASYLNSSDVSRALLQLNLSRESLLEANSTYSFMQPNDPLLAARVDAAYLQVAEKIVECTPSGTVTPSSLVKSTASFTTTLLSKVTSTTIADSKSESPSGSQILLVAAAVIVLSVVGFMFLRHRK